MDYKLPALLIVLPLLLWFAGVDIFKAIADVLGALPK